MTDTTNRRALLIGATGLVGGRLLTRLVATPAYSGVTTVGRRAPDLHDARVTHHITDFAGDRAGDSTFFSGFDVLFCCLGTTIKQAGSQRAFRAVDHGLVVSVARQAADNDIGTFIVVSSVGADPDSGNFYLRTKGEMEQAVTGLGFRRAGFVRPSLLLGARTEFRPAERLGQYAARLVNPLLAGALARYRAVDADTVAAAMIGLDRSAYEGVRIVEGNGIRRLAGAA